jgi:pimeloyl-ACP methyl ester carboxylesterase
MIKWHISYAYSKSSRVGRCELNGFNRTQNIMYVQFPLHSLADDVATVKRAIELVGAPTVLVGHSYGGIVITNAAYNNLS